VATDRFIAVIATGKSETRLEKGEKYDIAGMDVNLSLQYPWNTGV
jgi:hypothetical protein